MSPSLKSKFTNHALGIGVAIAFAFGIAVPGLVLADNGNDKASTVNGVHLNKQETRGRELFAHACNVCHTLSAVNSVGRIGPNLDVLVGEQLKGQAERRSFVLSTILNGLAIGEGNMPALLYQGKEAEDVADFVAAVAGH